MNNKSLIKTKRLLKNLLLIMGTLSFVKQTNVLGEIMTKKTTRPEEKEKEKRLVDPNSLFK